MAEKRPKRLRGSAVPAAISSSDSSRAAAGEIGERDGWKSSAGVLGHLRGPADDRLDTLTGAEKPAAPAS